MSGRDETETTATVDDVRSGDTASAREMAEDAPRVSLARLLDRNANVARAEREKIADALTNERRVGWFELDARTASTSASTSTFDVDATYDAARAFFSLPERTKCLYVHTQYGSESGGRTDA